MKTVVVAQTRYTWVGGAETSLRDLCGLLREAGHALTVIHGGPRIEESAMRGIHEACVPGMANEMMWTSATVKQIESVLTALKPDLVHFELVTSIDDPSIFEWSSKNFPTVITPRSHIFGCPVVKKVFHRPPSPCRRKPGKGCWTANYIYRCGSRNPLRFGKDLFRHRQLVRHALPVHRAIVLSQHVADTLLQVGFSHEQVQVLPPAICVCSSFSSYSKEQRTFDVLLVGRVEWDKGAHYLLQASKMVGNAHRIVVVGDGPYLSQLKMVAAELEVADHTVFMGSLPNHKMSEVYEQSAMVVMPSICPETFGRVGVEAMACGRPVLAFNVGAVREWLQDGKNGFLVDVRDVRGLAERVAFLLSNREVARRMGERGREMVERNFSPERHLNGLLDAYQAAMCAHGEAI